MHRKRQIIICGIIIILPLVIVRWKWEVIPLSLSGFLSLALYVALTSLSEKA